MSTHNAKSPTVGQGFLRWSSTEKKNLFALEVDSQAKQGTVGGDVPRQNSQNVEICCGEVAVTEIKLDMV